MPDHSNKQLELSTSITTLQNLYPNYLLNINHTDSYLLERNHLLTKLLDTNRALEEYDRLEEVYDREFIDRTENPQSVGLFSNLGLITTQDWVLAYFYLSYIIFSILLFITTIKSVKYKVYAGLFIFFVTGAVGAIITITIIMIA